MNRYLPLGLIALFLAFPDAADAQSLRGSRTSIDGMYRQALAHDLYFYQTPAGIRQAAEKGKFVRLSGNANYEMGSVTHPYVLPITRTFVQRLAAQYRSACGQKLVVTSAARPKSMRLANSADRSVHPTGMAIDLRKPTDRTCLSWLRRTLAYLDAQGVVEATEEYRPPHFHVAVFPEPYRQYLQGRGSPARVAMANPTAPRAHGPSAEDASGRTYKVRSGDSLWSIARRTRVTVEALKSANGLRSSRIVAGQVLVVPEASRAGN